MPKTAPRKTAPSRDSLVAGFVRRSFRGDTKGGRQTAPSGKTGYHWPGDTPRTLHSEPYKQWAGGHAATAARRATSLGIGTPTPKPPRQGDLPLMPPEKRNPVTGARPPIDPGMKTVTGNDSNIVPGRGVKTPKQGWKPGPPKRGWKPPKPKQAGGFQYGGGVRNIGGRKIW